MPELLRFAPAALLGVGCLLISGIREQQQVPPRAPMATVQLSTPGYTVRDIVVPEKERKIAGMSDYVMRAFNRDSLDPGFSVYLGYYDYQVQGKTIHSPKNCLPGAGWEQLNSRVDRVAIGGQTYPVNRFLLANKGAQALVYYWYQGRGRVEASEYVVKWHLLRDAALYGRTEEALVRVVVPVDPRRLRANDAKGAYAQADSIVNALAVQLIPRVDQLLPVAPGTT